MVRLVKTIRLKLLIAGGLCFFAVVPLVLLSAGYVFGFKDRFVAISMSPLNETAVEMGNGVDTAIAEIATDAALSAADANTMSEADSVKGLDELLHRDMIRIPRARAIALVDVGGHVIASMSRTGTKIDGDFSREPWFRAAADSAGAVEIDGIPTKIDRQIHLPLLDDKTSRAIVEPVVATLRRASGQVRGFWIVFIDQALFNDILSGAYTRTGSTGGDVGDAWEDFDIVAPDNTVLFSFKADSSTTGHPDDAMVGQPVLPFVAKLLADYDGNSAQFGTEGGMAYSALKASDSPGAPKTGWSIVAKTTKAEIMASIIKVEHAGMIGIVLFAALGVLCGVVFGSAITKPLLAIAARMRALQKGSKDAAVPNVDAQNEIGEMARAVESFRLSAIDRDALEARAHSERQAADSLRQSTEDARAAASREQGQVVDRLGRGLSRLADGDLTYRLPGEFHGGYAKLRSDFDTAAATLGTTIAGMTTAIDAIRLRNEEITHGADDLARRTEQQAAGLEETAASLDGLTTTVRSTAQGAASAEALMAVARSDAERSRRVVSDAVEAMKSIKSSAASITKVIDVINDMASQTNLLALNAGVEAARAGESGRGFAVVATEVRALAQRSAEAAAQIKKLIETSGQHVGEGVRLVDETGRALGAILLQVDEVHGVITGIASSTKEQAVSLNEINAVITQMDQITQKNAAMAEESNAACHGLMTETAKLANLAASFKVDGSMTAQPMRRRA